MKRRIPLVLVSTLLVLYVGIPGIRAARAKDKGLKPEEVIARHLESIGSAEALSAVRSRTVQGIVAVRRPLGILPGILPEPEKRTGTSNFLFVSSGSDLAMVMQFFDPEYPDDRFAFDGKSVTVSSTVLNRKTSMVNSGTSQSGQMISINGRTIFVNSPMIGSIGYFFDDKKSLLGNFIASHSGIVREGLLGGILSTAWPLLDVQGRKCKLKYKLIDKDGLKLHQLIYTPKSRRYLNAVETRLYFDSETFRHVMSEYVLMGQTNPEYLLLEKFGNFKDVQGLILPHSYSIEFSAWKSTDSTLWISEVTQVLHNVPIDPELFQVK
jgi:hypothetical protein